MMEVLIRKLEGFGPLSKDDKALVKSVPVRRRETDAKTDLIKEGDRPSDVQLIAAGFACRYKLLDGGKRQIVAYLAPGDFCDLHVFILKAMDHNIATLAESTVLEIPRASILQLLERPAVSRALLMATLVDEAVLREWVANIGQRPAEQRIAHLFCEMHARLKAVGLVEDGRFELPVTQAELGDTVGLSTVHVNRSLQALRDRDLIAFKGGSMEILDVERLRKMSDFRENYLHFLQEGQQEKTVATLS